MGVARNGRNGLSRRGVLAASAAAGIGWSMAGSRTASAAPTVTAEPTPRADVNCVTIVDPTKALVRTYDGQIMRVIPGLGENAALTGDFDL